MSVPAYPAYRDSGVEWLGGVPAHWAVVPLKRLARLITERADGRSFAVALENIEGWSGRLVESGGDYEGEGTAFAEGDILFGKLRPYLAKAWLADRPGEAVGDFHVLRSGSALSSAFLQRFLLSREVIDLINGSTFGAKMPRASWEFMGSLELPVPPLAEQASIVAFLDRETGKINALVEHQRRLIALLKEKRQAVISHAVTNGLNPHAPLKPSGIEWLGDVPAHWEVRSISSITTKITNGYVGPTRDILVDDGVRYLQSLHIKRNRIVFDTPYFVTAEWSEQHAKSILEAGDVLVVQTGDVGQTAVVSDEFAGCNCHALIILAPARKTVVGEWLSWVLNSTYGKSTLQSIQTGALHPHLNCGDVKDVYVPIPPVSEQTKIVENLQHQLSAMDALSVEAEAAVSLLQERRAALISAAVTGKIDVRGLVGSAAVMEMA